MGGGGRGVECGSPGAAAVAVCPSGVTEMHGLAFRPVRPGWVMGVGPCLAHEVFSFSCVFF